jgi:hypothetical protein
MIECQRKLLSAFDDGFVGEDSLPTAILANFIIDSCLMKIEHAGDLRLRQLHFQQG